MTCLSVNNKRRVPGGRWKTWRLPHATAWLLMAAVLTQAAAAWGKVRVVTTMTGYADIVRQVGGDYVSVQSVMRGPENPHHVSPRPSQMMKVKRADLFVHSGLDLEVWAELLVKGARNRNLLVGQPGNVNVSKGVKLKEVPPRGSLSRALGDIHVYGNPHYALDPLNGIIIAHTIATALERTDPNHAAEYERNEKAYAARLKEMTDRLVAKMAPYRGTKIVTYHRTWPYFRDRFGLVKITEVEPKPGISPGPQHLAACVEKMKTQGAKIVIVETYNSRKNAQFVAQKAGGQAVVLAQDVLAFPEVKTYEQLFEYNIDKLLAAFKKVGIEPHTDGHADREPVDGVMGSKH